MIKFSLLISTQSKISWLERVIRGQPLLPSPPRPVTERNLILLKGPLNIAAILCRKTTRQFPSGLCGADMHRKMETNPSNKERRTDVHRCSSLLGKGENFVHFCGVFCEAINRQIGRQGNTCRPIS